MKRLALPAFALAAVLAATPAPAATPAELAPRLDALIQRLAPPEAHVGVHVVRFGSGEVVYAREANKLFTPASLQKVATAGAALGLLGAQKRFTTRVMSQATVESGVLKGDLYLKGDGDPMLEAADLEKLAASLRAQGVREIGGDLVGDATVFAPEGRGPAGWAWDDLAEGYGATAGGLTLHRNAVTVTTTPAGRAGDPVRLEITPITSYLQVRNSARTLAAGEQGTLGLGLERFAPGSWQEALNVRGGLPTGAAADVEQLAVADPARFALTAFREALGRQGVALRGQPRLAGTPQGARTIAQHLSPPLADVVHEMLKESDNLLAETVLLHLGIKGKGGAGTWEKGLATLRGFLERAGWPADAYRLADGSGLSRYNAMSPVMLTRLLGYLPSQRLAYPSFLIGLPVAGVDGTLARRLAGPATRGRLRAKTGTMSGVSGLAGYLETQDGETLVVAVMTNGFVGPSTKIRQLQDALVETLAERTR
jgi:PBP4 family serine-type D-alanyl-D-alanine carboxypeptidase